MGLHSGIDVRIKILPSEPNTGIIFKRTDLQKNNIVIPDVFNVCSTFLCTTISNEYGVKVSTIEHLMGAFYGLGIDNVTDSKYYEHGIGLANIDPLVMAQGAQNLNMMIKAVSGTLGESDLFDVGKAMKQSSATDIMPNLKNAVAAKTANDQAVAGSGGGDISNVNAQDMSTNTTIMPGGGGGGGEPGTAHVPQNSGRASETDNPFVMF